MSEKDERTRNQRVTDNLKVVRMMPEGRELLADIFAKCEFGEENLLVPGQPDQTASRLGRQSVANWLAGLIEKGKK
jgi:hypothetical protein